MRSGRGGKHELTEKQRPVLGILVPTRNSESHLAELICLLREIPLDASQLEIVISDNSDPSRRFRDQGLDDRFRVIAPTEVLSMPRNFELAFEASSAEWVTFLGSDDGVLPNSIPLLVHELVEVKRFDAVLTTPAYFEPPDAEGPQHGTPLNRSGRFEMLVGQRDRLAVSSKRRMRRAPWSLLSAQRLPMPYARGVVRRDALQAIATRQGGRLILSSSPDVYLAWAIASTQPYFMELGARPYFVSGTSSDSNGRAVAGLRSGQEYRAKEFTQHSQEYPRDSSIATINVRNSILLELVDPWAKTAPLRGELSSIRKREVLIRLVLTETTLTSSDVGELLHELRVPAFAVSASQWTLERLIPLRRKLWTLRLQLNKLLQVLRGASYIAVTSEDFTTIADATAAMETLVESRSQSATLREFQINVSSHFPREDRFKFLNIRLLRSPWRASSFLAGRSLEDRREARGAGNAG